SLDTETVNIGAVVTLHNESLKSEMTYHIVGSAEADPAHGRISNESPVGRAILGHRVGDIVDIKTPDGVVQLRIDEIKKQ
ncbi:MAG TPA: GreA/GreB family elongation factor, partial [Clostridia bacterium]|nr:GreA/GreB family elongation factor [Clostridia bacterium]